MAIIHLKVTKSTTGLEALCGAKMGKIQNFEHIEAWKNAREMIRQEKLKLTGGDK